MSWTDFDELDLIAPDEPDDIDDCIECGFGNDMTGPECSMCYLERVRPVGEA